MITGIYLLRFNGTEKVYIGQSENIEYRYKKHVQKMRASTTTTKLQNAYNKYGTPQLEILLECESDELNDNEQAAIEVYDAATNGFNSTAEPDIHQKGELNGAAKYTNEQVASVLDALLNPNNSYADIEALTGVRLNTVRHIANGESHMWLKTTYPDKYAEMLTAKTQRMHTSNSAGARNKQYPAIISPSGVVYDNITNVKAFANEHGLDPSSLTKVLNKRPKYITHKGWKLTI